MAIEVGSTLTGTVVKVAGYGAIVRLPGGSTGLVHISEIADTYVRDVRDYLKEEDEVTVRVLRLSPKGRYDLSVKQAGAVPAKTEERQLVGAGAVRREQPASRWWEDHPRQAPTASFEDRLTRFLRDSEERQHDLKRNIEAKRGRR